MAWGFATPLIIETAVRNRVFDVLDSGPKTLDELAAATKTSTRGLRAILNALVGLDLLRRDGDRYGLTDEGAAFLVSTKPSFQGGIYHHISTQIIPAWLELDKIVRNGKIDGAVNQEDKGAEFFAQFVEDILPMSYKAAQAWPMPLADQLRPGRRREQGDGPRHRRGFRRMGDRSGPEVARGPRHGCRLAQGHADHEEDRRALRVGDRFHTVDGDLLEADFGTGHRVATLGHILHSEGEARSRKLLKRVFGPRPRRHDRDRRVRSRRRPHRPAAPLIFAVNMLVNTELGDTFTFRRDRRLARRKRLRTSRQLDAPSVSPLILADKPK